jgi:hypothetical protein
MFFVFEISASFAATITSIGSIDTSAENKAKVCKDVTCTNPTPGIIDFEISGNSPIKIDSNNGISGKAWGNELGWIIFNPSNGGVFFADSNTGLLKGTAQSENSDIINFSVTGQKVIIDLNTGEWNGWAWVSGQYGGWVKFDCENASCVKTTWRGQNTSTSDMDNVSSTLETEENITSTKVQEIANDVLNNFSSSFVNLYNGTKETAVEKSKIIGDNFNIIFERGTDLFSRTAEMTGNTYNSLSSYLMNLRNSLLNR